jgi:phage terminase large subunit GpA-like protein
MEALDRIEEGFLEAFRPPAKLSLSQWADQYAVLSAESSAEAGRWKTLPYQREIMDAFTDPAIEQISVIKSARVGYTKILNHAIGYHIHQDPCSIMLVQPTIEDAEGYSKEEIAPMLRDTPVLAGLVSESKAKDSANTILAKLFPGGTLGLVGANSPRGFRRVSRRVVLFDEVDGYPPSAGAEGDQIKLGIRRTEYFWNRKIVAGSTPTVKDHSRIERLFLQSDQRRYYVPCPTCGEFQYLKWSNLKWPEDEPEKAYFLCEANGCVMTHDRKRWMVERGQWRATAPGNGKHAGFHIWAAYSYSPNASWGQLALEFLEAKNDAESLKTFVNTVLGELWEDEYSAKVGADSLKSRAETYEPGTVPARALTLVAGIDVQDNRLSISLWAYGRDEEAWIVSRIVIFGDPAKPEIWKQLDEVLFRAYPHEFGGELRIAVAAIDSGGHFTHEVYAYVRERRSHKYTRVLAVKGQSQKGKAAIGKPTKVDINFRGQSLKSGAELFPVGSDTIKSVLYRRLQLSAPGPGFVHLNASLPDDFFQELTSEKKVTKFVRGFPVHEWVKKGRNEALDEAVYAYAAMQYLYSRYHRKTIWDQLERKLHIAGVPVDTKPAAESQGGDASSSPPASESSLKKQEPRRKLDPTRRSKGFVTGWRP